MKKILILLFTVFAFFSQAKALEIVYPKTNPVKINANSTFFIGSTNPKETLTINGVSVNLSKEGIFAQVVPLTYGVNNFKIVSGTDTVNFVINRPQPVKTVRLSATLIDYPIMSNFYVIKENAPLRATPVDGGINRLTHLPRDMQLFINGEKGDFYKVYLNSKLSGWIAKKDVEQRECTKDDLSTATINDFKIKDEKDFYIYEIDLNKKTPFIFKEENGLTLQIFNIDGYVDNTYCLNIPMVKLVGYDAYYKDNKFIVKIRKFHKPNNCEPLKNIVIAVDAGHGGSEFGAIGAFGDKEKDINLAIAKNLKSELEKCGAKVVMTREEDKNISLSDRVNFAREKEAELLISIHANALPDGADPIKNKGTSVYYYHNQAKPLADNVLNAMTTELGTQNDKVRQGSLALVRPTACVSILIEVAYMINPDDYTRLLDKNFQQNCAKAIADGIEKYILNLET